MSLARALRLLLALALLVAWQNALVHPLAHLDHDGGLVHLDGGHDEGDGANASCDAIAAVAAVIGGGAAMDTAQVSHSEQFHPAKAAASMSAPLLAYRSQAPPQFS
jgi:hypothetical protein